MNNEQREIVLELLLEKGKRNLEQAKANATLGYWDLVANRLYYAIFHTVTALMMKDGIKIRSHKGTSSQFGKYYVITKKFPREYGVLYSRLQTMREKADYQNTFSLDERDGENLIKRVEIFHEDLLRAFKEKS